MILQHGSDLKKMFSGDTLFENVYFKVEDIRLALESGSGDTSALIQRQASLQERFIELDGYLEEWEALQQEADTL